MDAAVNHEAPGWVELAGCEHAIDAVPQARARLEPLAVKKLATVRVKRGWKVVVTCHLAFRAGQRHRVDIHPSFVPESMCGEHFLECPLVTA